MNSVKVQQAAYHIRDHEINLLDKSSPFSSKTLPQFEQTRAAQKNIRPPALHTVIQSHQT
jgi:hypothetical protein